MAGHLIRHSQPWRSVATVGVLAALFFATALESADARLFVRGAKADRVVGTSRADTMRLGRGNDRASGRAGRDRIFGQGGHDRLRGDAGNDQLQGSAGRDRLTGGTGRDRLSGGTGRDLLSGGSGADRLFGGRDADRLLGGTGNDDVRGEGGADHVSGGAGRDRISGGHGNDVLRADDGGADSRVDGGPGQDVCHVDAADALVVGCEQIIGRPPAPAPVSTPAPSAGTGTPTVPAPGTGSTSTPPAAIPAITLPGGISVPIPQLPLPENGRIEITGAAFSGCVRALPLLPPLTCNLGVTGIKGDGTVVVLANATSLDLNLSLAGGLAAADGTWSAVGVQLSLLNLLTCPAGQSREIIAVSVGVDGAPVETSDPFSIACPS